MQSFGKQYLKLVLLSNLKYVINEIFLYKMSNGHLNIFINQFHFNSLLDQGHFVNALDSTLAYFIAWATPFLKAYGSHPYCKVKVALQWYTGILKVIIEQNDTYSFTDMHSLMLSSKLSFKFNKFWKTFYSQWWCSKWNSVVFNDQIHTWLNKLPSLFSNTVIRKTCRLFWTARPWFYVRLINIFLVVMWFGSKVFLSRWQPVILIILY